MFRITFLLLLLLSVACMPRVLAATGVQAPAPVALDLSRPFEPQRQAIALRLQADSRGTTFGTALQRQAVIDALARIATALGGSSVDRLAAQVRARVLADQRYINLALESARRAAEAVCWRTAPPQLRVTCRSAATLRPDELPLDPGLYLGQPPRVE